MLTNLLSYCQTYKSYSLNEVINNDTLSNIESVIVSYNDCDNSWRFFNNIKFTHSLKEIIILKCKLGKFPENISLITTLNSLTLYACSIDSINQSISKLQNLQTLDISYNKINNIPNEVFGLRNLEYLNVEFCNLSNISDSICNLLKLKTLLISGNKINNWGFLGSTKKISELYMINCGIKQIPSSFNNLTTLKKIHLGYNTSIEVDSLFSILNQYSNGIEYISLSNCGLKKIPINIKFLKNLKELHLEGNKFSRRNKKYIYDSLPNCKIFFDNQPVKLPIHGL